MATSPIIDQALATATERAARELVSCRHWGGSSYVTLPLVGPDGSSIIIRVTQDMLGFKIDDAGATHRDLQRLGLERSFTRTAASVIGENEVSINDSALVTFATGPDDLGQAIMEVGLTAWSIMDRIYDRLDDASEDEIAQDLRVRLANIFGSSLEDKQTIGGLSTTLWSVSAILHVDHKLAVFQAVTDHANSVYRASAAFHDLASLPDPPALVAVVKDKAQLGPKLSILSQAARVIEQSQPDDVYRRAAL
ncbi:hypothetical protein HRJ34_09575 [Rhizorhabdus wittichii]|uniref:Uncharacterized protein n=1 Tax=Rhizorhabdus wittichii TaxID=160791 RepID=A0A975D6M3_9SPHN|nr:hypothetical protein [Rhizorhabdus wittichii]QTH23724.1 hypothetical protein HRJ34_09575 [Rhizorhabdus wittichii]